MDGWLIFIALLTVGPVLLYCRNVTQYRRPPLPPSGTEIPPVSVLIPARNEESSIGEAIASIQASEGVEFEIVVLDDHSSDRTADIVRAAALKDHRVRLETAAALPAGWCGKQYACHQLAQHARYDWLSFLGADVRLSPDALLRMIEFKRQSRAALVSGFPRQLTGSLLEHLVIPLMHWLLLGFLPLDRMRQELRPGLGAGCGQWFLTDRSSYLQAGGHAAIRESLHDGVKLPRAYRRAGLMTDLCDVTLLARCRMYHNASQVWMGLAKNAHEGLGAPRLLPLTTVLMFGGQVLPWILAGIGIISGQSWGWAALGLGILSLAPRWHAAIRFRQSLLGATWHPVGVLCLLSIQWYAALRRAIGAPVGWKGRAAPPRMSPANPS